MSSVQVSFRKILLGSVAAALLAVPALAEVKVGVVDYGRLLKESPQVKALSDRSTPNSIRATSSS